MKKISLILCFVLILLVSSFQLISATVTEQNNFKYAYYDSSKNLVTTSELVNGVNALAFICADSACSSFSGILWEKSTASSSLTFTYPTTLQGKGYAIYIYKDGYIPYEKYSTYYGDGAAPNYTDYLTKVEACSSTINNFQVSVTEQAVNINLIVDSPIEHAGNLDYVPTQLISQYSTTVDVDLEIKNSNEDIVYSETKQKTIEFSGTSQVSFSKTLSPGDYAINVYTSLDNEAKCLSYNPDSETASIHINEPDTNPEINSISANPNSGFIPLEVEFSCSADSGNGQLSYSWTFGDGETSDSQNPTHIYTEFGIYTATCTVEDSDADIDSATVNINAEKDILEITDLTCFENVIENNNQSCSVYVEDSSGNPVSDAETKIYYEGGELFGECNTNSISGGCVVKDLQEEVGEFTLYATATKNDFESDDDKNPEFSYSVLEEKYEITDLKVYNDENFQNEDYDFFRGESLYVSFKVIGDNGPAEDMITKATLVSLPGGRVDLTEIENHDGEYFYKLNLIPLTHDFFGDSNIFAFAFNFTDGSGGQSEVNLIIRNNLPAIENIDEQKVYVGDELTINLEDYENDLEDSGDDLRWEVNEGSEYFNAAIDEKILKIEGIKKGVASLTLRLYDLNNDFAEINVSVIVKKKSNGGGGGGDSNNIIGHKEVFEPVTFSSGGIGYFIEEEPAKEIKEGWFVKFLKAGYGLLLMMLLLLILLILLMIVKIKRK